MPETHSPPRYITLDALRGFAVMGILAMNIVAFDMPEWSYVSPVIFGADHLADKMSWLFSSIFIDGKMRGVFSVLFGASMMLIVDRAEAKGENPARVHYMRMGWLALFGLAHYFLIWFGDILFTYAMVGCIAFRFHTWEARRLIKWALIVYALGTLWLLAQVGGLQVMQWMAAQPGTDPATIRAFHGVINGAEFDPEIAKNLAIHRGSWMGIVTHKLDDWFSPVSSVMIALPESLPFMMLGMAMQKNEFITGTWDEADYRRWINRLLLPGLLLAAVFSAWVWMSGFDKITALANFLGWSGIPRVMLTIAYVALLVLLVRRNARRRWIARVAATGRAAFSNYLGTSIVMTTIFYGYGLGFYGHYSRIELWPFVLGAWAIMLLWSKPWLDRFHYGPLEWLWRSLARMQMQPFRK